MIAESLDHLEQHQREVFKSRQMAALREPLPPRDQPVPHRAEAGQARARPRMSMEQVMIFWNCMFPYGWSLGGLVMLLVSSRRKKAAPTSGASPALGSILLGLISTLCYFVAVAQTGKSRAAHASQQSEIHHPGKTEGPSGKD